MEGPLKKQILRFAQNDKFMIRGVDWRGARSSLRRNLK